MKLVGKTNRYGYLLLAIALLITTAIYWAGLSGSWLFDDYPNIVENLGVQPHRASIASLTRAALSSPSSEFKRPMASLSFAANYLATGLDPYWMKLTNLVIHLLNGLLVFWLARALFERARSLAGAASAAKRGLPSASMLAGGGVERSFAAETAPTGERQREGILAALIAAAWMLLPINLTGVLYVVQRMESMANLFVLIGLIGYVAGRRLMLSTTSCVLEKSKAPQRRATSTRGFLLCIFSIVALTAIGVLAKETAVMLPLYALLVEWILFHFKNARGKYDYRLFGLFILVLLIPLIAGLAWQLPKLLNPGYWATRDFGLHTRLLSEARIVVDYIVWTVLPTPHALSFYHDNFHASQGLFTPWTTAACIIVLAALVWLTCWLRKRQPLVSLGIALFLGCHLLTGTVLPLELVYEHRNYFASFGLMLALVPLLTAPDRASAGVASASVGAASVGGLPMVLPRYILMGGLMLCWATLTALTAYAWGNPLRLAQDLAARAPQSPRAQYELGRTYIIYSHYDPASPFIQLAYAPLEKAASLPKSSILPQQALIFMNARMHLPLKNKWWDSMIAKLKARKPGVQDESSLGALTKCAEDHQCDLPQTQMVSAYLAALSHPYPSARLLAMYGDYAWNVLGDHALGLRVTRAAVHTSPNEPAYQITLVRMLVAKDDLDEARKILAHMQTLNMGGELDGSLKELRHLPGMTH